MWITKTSINHPVFATMVMVGIMVLGLFSYRSLPLESMPSVEIPFSWVEVQYPGASPEQVENDITRPLEDAINSVSGIKTIRSNSWEGRAGVSLEFQLSTNVAKEPLVIRAEGDNEQPIVEMSLMSDRRSLREMSTLTDQVVTKRL